MPLGEIRTDDAGRLIVLGGFGQSEYVGVGSPSNLEMNFANNDDWHDDVSDGPVAAVVKIPGREPVSADPAWVIVAPPKYAPRPRGCRRDSGQPQGPAGASAAGSARGRLA